MLDLARRVAGMARDGEQIEAYVARSLTTSVKVYDGEVESLTSAESFGVGIRVVIGKRQGFAHCGSLDERLMLETLQEARDNAGFGEPDEFNGVAEFDGVEPVQHDLWREELVRFPTDKKVALALDLERRVRSLDPRVRGVRNAIYGDSVGEGAVANSLGVAGYERGTLCSVSVSALAEDQGETKIGAGLDASRDPAGLDLDKVAHDAVERAVRMFGATKPASQRLAIVLEPRLAAVILGIVGGMLSGERLLKGRTPFAGREDELIASPLISLVDDPTDPASLGAGSYDGEGLACRRNVLIENGVLRRFLHNSYTGRRSGAGSTGSAVRGSSTPSVGCQALAITPGSANFGDLV
ncbi:MAG: TldD/PmbA family protein, partial [Acidimicrobiales bacterium]|nr:TldD/PmbA family protein [Acidimicrobiales bacterium]